jgi:SAM-dependent methyltransferase
MPSPAEDPRRHAPATLRNRAPILEVLHRALPETGLVLEIASGSGEHAVAFAAALPRIAWQPTDRDPRALASIAAHAADADLPNLRAPLRLDVEAPTWPVDGAAAVVCCNMIHIAPWSACAGLLAGAARTLVPGGLLYLYGPFQRDGRHTADSNRAFDEDLRRRNPAWGVRDLGEVTALAEANGLRRMEIVEMPANNLSVLFRRLAPG